MKYLRILLCCIVVSFLLCGCNKRDYSNEEVIEFVSERYGDNYECISISGNTYVFQLVTARKLRPTEFTVTQERSHHMIDASAIGSYPVLVSDYQEVLFESKQDDLQEFIESNNLYVESHGMYCYKMYTDRNSEAEFRGLKNYIEDLLDDANFGYTDYEFRESLSIQIDYYSGDTPVILDHINIL